MVITCLWHGYISLVMICSRDVPELGLGVEFSEVQCTASPCSPLLLPPLHHLPPFIAPSSFCYPCMDKDHCASLAVCLELDCTQQHWLSVTFSLAFDFASLFPPWISVFLSLSPSTLWFSVFLPSFFHFTRFIYLNAITQTGFNQLVIWPPPNAIHPAVSALELAWKWRPRFPFLKKQFGAHLR